MELKLFLLINSFFHFFDPGIPLYRPNICLIILKSCIDGISHRQTLNRLSVKIANSLEMEARITLFQNKDTKGFRQIAKRMSSSKSIPLTENKYVYKKNVWVYYMNKANLEFAKWDKVERVHLGTKCIELASILGLVTCQTRKVARNKSIKYVKMGKIKEAERAIRPAVNYLMKIKCRKIILGCTELPIAIFAFKSFKKIKESKIFIDPNFLLASVSMKKYSRS